MISPYNLTEKNWIPAVPCEGVAREVSLRDALVDAHELREIADNSPLTTVALLLLLLTVLQRCWRGTKRRERRAEWTKLWDTKRFDAEAIDAYLGSDKARDRFDLFHAQYPFYQVAGLKMAETSSLSRLAMEERNTSAMLANPTNHDWTAPSPAQAARLLVTIQSFALGFGKSSNAVIGAEPIEPPYSADAPLLRGLTLWPGGKNLFATLMAGLVPAESEPDDAPCWEIDQPYDLRDRATSAGRKTTPPRGVCDLLTLQSRLIRLLPEEREGETVVPSAYFTQGRSLEKGVVGKLKYHPFKVYQQGKDGFVPLSLNENKAVWRNAHALLSAENVKTDEQNPLHFLPTAGLPSKQQFQLHVVGMASDPGKAGKFLLWRHDRFPLPLALLERQELINELHRANEAADAIAEVMRVRFARVATVFLSPQRDGGHKPDREDVKNLVDKFDPRRAYWPRLEHHFYELMEDLPDDADAAMAIWNKAVEHNANECFQAALNALGRSPNAVVAAAQVSPYFYLKSQGAETATAADAKEVNA